MPLGPRTFHVGAGKGSNRSTGGDHNGVGRRGRPANQTIRGMMQGKRDNPPLVNNPLSFDSVDPVRYRNPFAGSSTLAARPLSREAKTLSHSADGRFQTIDAGSLIRHSILKPCELEIITSRPVRARLVHRTREGGVKQMHHHIMVELGMLAILVPMKLP